MGIKRYCVVSWSKLIEKQNWRTHKVHLRVIIEWKMKTKVTNKKSENGKCKKNLSLFARRFRFVPVDVYRSFQLASFNTLDEDFTSRHNSHTMSRADCRDKLTMTLVVRVSNSNWLIMREKLQVTSKKARWLQNFIRKQLQFQIYFFHTKKKTPNLPKITTHDSQNEVTSQITMDQSVNPWLRHHWVYIIFCFSSILATRESLSLIFLLFFHSFASRRDKLGNLNSLKSANKQLARGRHCGVIKITVLRGKLRNICARLSHFFSGISNQIRCG